MEDLSTLRLVVDGEAGTRTLERYDAAASKAHRSSGLLDEAVTKVTQAFALYKVVEVARDTIGLSDAYASVNARLALVSGGTANLANVQADLFEIAQRSRQVFEGTADLYTRVARASTDLGASQAELRDFTEGASLALRISNTAAAASAGALQQLGQAIGGSKVQAEEFNSILDGAPRILQAVADGMGTTGISVARLRAEVIAGNVSSREFFDAALIGFGKVKAEAATLPETVGGAITQVRNAMLLFVGTSESVSAVTSTLASSLTLLSQNLDTLATAGTAVAVVLGARFLSGAAESLGTYVRSLTIARAETLAYAENAARSALAQQAVAQAEVVATEARLADVAATQQAIIAERALQTARLGAANASIASLTSDPNKSTAQALRDAESLIRVDRVRIDSTRELARLGEIQQVATARETEALLAGAAARRALTTATGAAAVATAELTAVQSLSTVAMTAAANAAKVMWAAIGGPIGAILIGLYAVYQIFYDNSREMEAAAKRTQELEARSAAYAKTLGTMSAEALKAAESQQRLNVAIAAGQAQAAGSTLVAARGARNSGGDGASRAAGLLDAEAAEKAYAAALANVTEQQTNLNAITGQLAPLVKAAATASAGVAAANEERVRLAQQALALAYLDGEAAARQAVENTRINELVKARAELKGADLASTEAAINRVAALGQATVTVNERMRTYAAFWEAFATRATTATSALDSGIENLNARLSAGSKAWLDQRDAIDAVKAARDQQFKSAEGELDALRFQVDLLGKTQAQQEGLADLENYRLAIAKNFTTEQANQFVELQRTLRNAATETETWKGSLETVADVASDIAGIFGGMGTELTKAIQLAAQLGTAIARSRSADAVATAARGTSNEASTAGAAASAGLASGLAIFSVATTAIGLLAGSSRAAADAAREAARALLELRVAAKNNLENYVSLTNDPLSQTLAGLKGGFDDIIKQLVAAGGTKPASFGPRKAVNVVPTETDFFAALAAYEKLVAAAKRAAEFQLAQADLELDARLAAAQGRTAESDAIRRLIANEAELEAVRVKGGDTAKLMLVQFAEEAKRIADESRRVGRSVFDTTNSTLAFTDPRGANQAAFEESARRRIEDAGTAAEKLAAEAYNAAAALDRMTQIAEKDASDTLGLLARIAAASGDTRGSEDLSRFQSNRDELNAAIRDGMSPTNLALLKYAQFAQASQVQMQRNIEDATKAIRDAADAEIKANQLLIDAVRSDSAQRIAALNTQIDAEQKAAQVTARAYDRQIDAIRTQTKTQVDAIDAQIDASREALSTAKAQLSVLEKNVETAQRVVEAITDFRNASLLGNLTPLSPLDQKAEADRQFSELLAKAQGGDADAAGKLPAAAQAFLEAARAFDGSTPAYVEVFNRVQAALAAVQDQFGKSLPADLAALEAARATVAGLERTIDALGQQKEAIQNAAERQINVLERAKEEAAERSASIIEQLTLQRDAIQEAADAEIARLEAINVTIENAAAADIALVTAFETEAHQQRLKQYEAANAIAQLTEQANIEARAYYASIADFLSTFGNAQRVDGPLVSTQEPLAVVVVPQGDSVAAESLEEQRAQRVLMQRLADENASLRIENRELLQRIASTEAAGTTAIVGELRTVSARIGNLASSALLAKASAGTKGR